jgi:peptide/nickel transport system permease protein
LGLRGYLLKRLVNTLILIVFVITINFVIFELMPGTQGAIINLISNPRANENPAEQQRLMQLYGICQGFDKNGNCIPFPIWNRFATYFMNMITFRFGDSFQTGQPVLHDMIATGRLENTLLLLGTSTAISLLIGTLLGVVVASKRGTLFDSGWVTTSLVTYSLPTFYMGLIFILVFAQYLKWFPSGNVTPPEWAIGLPPFTTQILVRIQHLFLPALTLTLFFYGGHLLLTRATMVEALSEDYIMTAKAKGVPQRSILFKHALKNAALPLVTNAALSFGSILSGAIITETVFQWDGLGLWIFGSITWRDFPVMQAIFFVVALCVIAANFISDIIYGMIDPRIKYQ